MLRPARKFLGYLDCVRLPAEVRQTNRMRKPSELYTVRENERDVKCFLQYVRSGAISVRVPPQNGPRLVWSASLQCADSKQLNVQFNLFVPSTQRGRPPVSTQSLLVSSPECAIQGAVLDGFGDVLGLDSLSSFQISDGSSDFEDAIVGARGQALLGHGALQQPLAIR